MKPIKRLGLAALVALMAMAFVGVSLARAEDIAFCKKLASVCPEKEIIKHLHAESEGHALMLSPITTVECTALALGSFLNGGLHNPLVLHNTFTLNCLNGCTVTEENGPAEIKFSEGGSELATVTGEWLWHVVCGLNCRYNGVGLEGHALGASAATNEIGEATFEEAVVNKESGLFCPSTTRLDVRFEWLEILWFSS